MRTLILTNPLRSNGGVWQWGCNYNRLFVLQCGFCAATAVVVVFIHNVHTSAVREPAEIKWLKPLAPSAYGNSHSSTAMYKPAK